MEFTFEQSPWELAVDKLRQGDRISAMYCLHLLEDMSQEEAEESLLALEERGITLDVSDLPKDSGSGETAVRLRFEQKLSQSGKLLNGLEENDPLRLYLEELYNTLLELKKAKEYPADVYRDFRKSFRKELRKNGKELGYIWKKHKYMYIYAYPAMKWFAFLESKITKLTRRFRHEK